MKFNCKSVDIVNNEIDSVRMVFGGEKIGEVDFNFGSPIK